MSAVEEWTDEQLDLAINDAYIPRIPGQGSLMREAFVALRAARTRIAELKAENTELRKQGEILSTARRLEEKARGQAEAALGERNRMLDRIANAHFPGLPEAQAMWLQTFRVEAQTDLRARCAEESDRIWDGPEQFTEKNI